MKNISTAKKHVLFHLMGSNLKKVPALVGKTGIGKTAILEKVAEEMDSELIYFNVAQLSEGELALPIPTAQYGEALVKYSLNYKIQKALDNSQKGYILFFDEFTRGTIPVISELMTVINERTIQGHNFHDNIKIVVAMNPSTSMRDFEDTDYVATEMDDAHANRFVFIHVEEDVNDWLSWAKSEGNIHTLVTSFLEHPKHRLDFYGQETNGIRMRTPRSWDFLSTSLKDMEEQGILNDYSFMAEVVGDQIGYDMSKLFVDFARDALATIEMEEVFSDKKIAKSTVNKFKSYEQVKQKQTLSGFIDTLKVSPDNFEINDTALANFFTLWNEVKGIDLKYALTVEIANNLFNVDYNGKKLAFMFYDETNPVCNDFMEFTKEKQDTLS